MTNIIFNYIFGLAFQSPFSNWKFWKWTLESKSEHIVENDIYHLVIFQKCILLLLILFTIKVYARINIFKPYLSN